MRQRRRRITQLHLRIITRRQQHKLTLLHVRDIQRRKLTRFRQRDINRCRIIIQLLQWHLEESLIRDRMGIMPSILRAQILGLPRIMLAQILEL